MLFNTIFLYHMKMTLFWNIDFYYEFNFTILLVFFLSFSLVIFFKTLCARTMPPFLPFCYHYFCHVVGETPALSKIMALCLHFTIFTNSPCFHFEPCFELQSKANEDTLRYSCLLSELHKSICVTTDI